MITLSDFQDIDLRIARVESVEPHPNADKLLLIKLDLGGEQKQTVAGLKEYYSSDELIGKHVVVVNNLEPAKLRGVESQCMLLAAQAEGKVVLLVPEKEVSPGAKVL